jgi:hypothetical protein
MFRTPVQQRDGSYKYFNRRDLTKPKSPLPVEQETAGGIVYEKQQNNKSTLKDIPVDELSRMISGLKVRNPKPKRKTNFV